MTPIRLCSNTRVAYAVRAGGGHKWIAPPRKAVVEPGLVWGGWREGPGMDPVTVGAVLEAAVGSAREMCAQIWAGVSTLAPHAGA